MRGRMRGTEREFKGGREVILVVQEVGPSGLRNAICPGKVSFQEAQTVNQS